MAKTATTIRNNNQAMTQTVCTHERRSSKASDPRNKTQNAIPGIHLRLHFGHFMPLPPHLPCCHEQQAENYGASIRRLTIRGSSAPFAYRRAQPQGHCQPLGVRASTRGQFPKVICQNDEYRKRQQRITELSKPLKDADL